MKHLLKIICLLLSMELHGELADHFKKCPNKSSVHKYGSIDFIYMINLDHRPEKYEKSLNQLQHYGIVPYRFSGVNGWELSWDTINDVGLVYKPGMLEGVMGSVYNREDNLEGKHEVIEREGKTYFSHCMSRGAIGIALSHLSVLQDAYDSGYQLIWVMEDDIEVLQDPKIIPELVEKLDKAVGYRNWDVLFTDRDLRDKNGNYVPYRAIYPYRPDFYSFPHNDYTVRKVCKGTFIRVGARFGATSMLITRRGMDKILTFFKAHKIFLPYDMDYVFPPGIRMYSVLKDVVTNLTHSISDNGNPNYLKD